ncbi:splicing factor 3B subunit [Gregarina niphandrodes]|uniref:Splicing factor 3B subunit n=1 Tax=Gregarina niphandrodes TaxID=110365 RepID=A0A023B515_GRENI|nr:splicing factor 3B subunit [Gregarina niphandrodes]EZG58020.1 splicing factor 3B subunit [Gregarina niphandrodes]|eukprot:XP_011130993.1 splicing factor 3B subunit [Gregarina niphandrodes]
MYGGGDGINPLYERNQEATLYAGNLDRRVSEDVLWELCIQAGPVKHVHVPRDKITGQHQGYGFIEYEQEVDAEYAIRIFSTTCLYGKPLRLNKAAQDKKMFEVGANLFVGNLAPQVDERKLFETFAAFGNVTSAKIMKDPETSESRGFGFISYDNFQSADSAIKTLSGQFLSDKQITVTYAFKKDSQERHGSAAERLIAEHRRSSPLFSFNQS